MPSIRRCLPGLLAALIATLIATLLAGCSGTPTALVAPSSATGTTAAAPTTTTPTTPPRIIIGTTPGMSPWQVGASPLPLQPNGFGEVLPTPPQLVVRRLPTTDFLPPPADGRYHATVQPVPAAVLARSTWQPACPVPSSALAYLTMSFWGFDGKPHTGEMLVNASMAAGITRVFGQLFANRFPIEQMRVASPADMTAPPTGDGNTTTGFACRPTRGQTSWSAHAYGLAVDVNPFCNPYHNGSLVLPELASAYLNRGWVRPGMVLPGDATVRAFASIGWQWGGSWTAPRDLMHFTRTGE